MEKNTILVTGIGGNVGQGILRNLASSQYGLRLIGCDIAENTVANFLCQKHYKVPYAFHEDYVPSINQIIEKENIKLVIPSTDYETVYLSKQRELIKAPIACSDYATSMAFNDKYLTHQLFEKLDIPFAKAFLPSEYNFQFDKCIAKPRKGSGSKGLILNPTKWSHLSDEEYMIQELIEGLEISTAFYVNTNNKLHSHISFERELRNGTTTFCKTVNYVDNELHKIIQKLITHVPIKGACNIQYILNQDGSIIPFEINCRISGTNSIRSNFGFEDVKWTVQEYLLGLPLENPVLKKGIATRMLLDVVFQDIENYSDIDSSLQYTIF